MRDGGGEGDFEGLSGRRARRRCVLTLFMICVNIKMYVLTKNIWWDGIFGVPLQRVSNINPQDLERQSRNENRRF